MKMKCYIITICTVFLSCGIIDNKPNHIIINSIEIITINKNKPNDIGIKYDLYPTLSGVNDQYPLLLNYWDLYQYHYSDSCCWIFNSNNAKLPDTVSRMVYKVNLFYVYPDGNGNNISYYIGGVPLNIDYDKSNEILTDSTKNIELKLNYDLIK